MNIKKISKLRDRLSDEICEVVLDEEYNTTISYEPYEETFTLYSDGTRITLILAESKALFRYLKGKL